MTQDYIRPPVLVLGPEDVLQIGCHLPGAGVVMVHTFKDTEGEQRYSVVLSLPTAKKWVWACLETLHDQIPPGDAATEPPIMHEAIQWDDEARVRLIFDHGQRFTFYSEHELEEEDNETPRPSRAVLLTRDQMRDLLTAVLWAVQSIELDAKAKSAPPTPRRLDRKLN